jgi:catechol 2,3-dioxygenase-like lactoylglutathione lyase family enzyme
MRGFMLFVAGLAMGLMVQTLAAQNMTPNRGLVGLNHVGVAVPNLNEAITYYTKTLGFPEAFRSLDEKGQPRLVYVHITRNTFIELQPGNPQGPAMINHLGIQVESMKPVVEMFKQRGVNVSDIRVSPTKAILSNITDPNMLRIELAELAPDSQHYQAIQKLALS